MSEKDFDRKLASKFREAFSDYEVAYRQADWEKLSAKLHKSPFIKIWHNPYIVSLAVAAGVALLFVSYFLIKENTRKIDAIENQYTENKAIDSTIEQQKEIEEIAEKEVITSQKNTLTPQKEIVKIEIPKDVEEVQNQTNSKTQTDNTSQVLVAKTSTKEIKKQVVEIFVVIPENKKETITEQKFIVPLFSIATLQMDSTLFVYEASKPVGDIDLTLRKSSKKTEKKKVFIPIIFGLAFNPLTYKNSMDKFLTVETGLQMSIPIANHLKLTTGVLIANQKMQYKKENRISKEFLFMADSTKSPVGIFNTPRASVIAISNEMSNNLLIINVPINLQYSFGYSQKAHFFASVGVSNYAYLTEKYRFTGKINAIYYNDNDGRGIGQPNFPSATGTMPRFTPNPVDYELVSENKYESFSQIDFLGGLNLSTGIEYLVGNHFSLQIAPFVRLPLKEIGREKLNFDTFGLALALNYK
jgi:hypothetical protein